MTLLANDWKKQARGLALVVLENVFEEGAYSNITLNQELKQTQLSQKDKSLVTEIVYGTVARKITLEWYLAHYIEDRDKVDPWVYYLLMLSLYQLLYLDKMPAHAVVNDAVNIAKNRGNKKGAEKFVNAVLRRLTKDDLPNPESIKRKNKRYSVLYSLPVSFIMIYLINLSTGGLYDFGHIIVPYKAILIAILGVFILILMTTLYSARKIKKENILDALKDENI